MFDEIANADLSESNIPVPSAEWHRIAEFALTFDGYGYRGSFEKCAEVANQAAEAYARQQVLPDSLTELRTCLFFEQRRYHHFGQSPDEQAKGYIRALVQGIRQKVRAKEIE